MRTSLVAFVFVHAICQFFQALYAMEIRDEPERGRTERNFLVESPYISMLKADKRLQVMTLDAIVFNIIDKSAADLLIKMKDDPAVRV